MAGKQARRRRPRAYSGQKKRQENRKAANRLFSHAALMSGPEKKKVGRRAATPETITDPMHASF